MRAGSWSYINKRPSQWEALKALLATQTFYLVHRPGPTVFALRDDAANTFKCTLGSPHTCSCLNTTGYLCIHQLFCLLKILRIDDAHPLAFQIGFTDAETEQVLAGSCSSPPRGRTHASNPSTMASLSAIARARRKALAAGAHGGSSVSVDGESLGSAVTDPSHVTRQVLDDDGDTCAICQDMLSMAQALSWCRKGCGNNLHAKCMQVWV